VQLICANSNIESVLNFAEQVYNQLNEKGIEVLYDDRNEITAGFKFKDADLIGTPVHIIIGEKNLKNGNVEIKLRKSGERHIISKDDLMNRLPEFLKK
jgi:prolyl-tRNA synthetase